jgi:hypothetical protein
MIQPLKGQLLNQKDSARLSMLDAVGRERLIEAIAKRIRLKAKQKLATPKDWYR